MHKLIQEALVLVIRFYQRAVSPAFGQRCRFYPSCSQYMIDAVRAKGVLRGVWMGARRILKCHPFNPGGYDPVK
jgi:putative membrane protein insertion efficiency factor